MVIHVKAVAVLPIFAAAVVSMAAGVFASLLLVGSAILGVLRLGEHLWGSREVVGTAHGLGLLGRDGLIVEHASCLVFAVTSTTATTRSTIGSHGRFRVGDLSGLARFPWSQSVPRYLRDL